MTLQIKKHLFLLTIGLFTLVAYASQTVYGFEGYSYKIDYATNYKNTVGFLFDLECSWDENRKAWKVYPFMRYTLNNNESDEKYRLVNVKNNEIWRASFNFNQNEPTSININSDKQAWDIKIVDINGSELQGSEMNRVKLNYNFHINGKKPRRGRSAKFAYDGFFKLQNFEGSFIDKAAEIAYKLSEFQWIKNPASKEGKAGMHTLQARINKELPALKTKSKPVEKAEPKSLVNETVEEIYRPKLVTNIPLSSKTSSLPKNKPGSNKSKTIELSNSGAPVKVQSKSPERIVKANSYPISKEPNISETLIIVCMRNQDWRKIAMKASINMLENLKQQHIAFALGENGNIDILAHAGKIGGNKREISEAKRMADLKKKKPRNLRLVKLLQLAPDAIKESGLSRPAKIIIIMETDYNADGNTDDLDPILNELFKEVAYLNIIYLTKNDSCDSQAFYKQLEYIVGKNAQCDYIYMENMKDEDKSLDVITGKLAEVLKQRPVINYAKADADLEQSGFSFSSENDEVFEKKLVFKDDPFFPRTAICTLIFRKTYNGAFTVKAAAVGFPPNTAYRITLSGHKEKQGNDILLKFNKNDSTGEGFIDIDTLTTNSKGVIKHVATYDLPSGFYNIKVSLKQNAPPYYSVMQNDQLQFTVNKKREYKVATFGNTAKQMEYGNNSISFDMPESIDKHAFLIKGNGAAPGSYIYVFVNAMDTETWTSQKSALVANNGEWSCYCYFGSKNSGEGKPYEVVAIASNKLGEFSKGQIIEHNEWQAMLTKYQYAGPKVTERAE